MATIQDITDHIERIAPRFLTESWDNTGLLCGSPGGGVTGVLLAVDVTPAVIELARKKNCNLIVSHHPPIFKPLYSLSDETAAARTVTAAVRADIALYAAHTNLDQAPGGVNHALADRLGITNVRPLYGGNGTRKKMVVFTPPGHADDIRTAAARHGAGTIGEYTSCSFATSGTGTFIPSEKATPYQGTAGTLERADEVRLEMVMPAWCAGAVLRAVVSAHPYEEPAIDIIPLDNGDTRYGYGCIGTLDEPMSPSSFLVHVARELTVDGITHSQGPGDLIRSVAVMGGSGGSAIPHAVAAHADALVTGEIGHHDFCDYGDRLFLVDATHYATERPVLDSLKASLENDPITNSIPVNIYDDFAHNTNPYSFYSV